MEEGVIQLSLLVLPSMLMHMLGFHAAWSLIVTDLLVRQTGESCRQQTHRGGIVYSS